MSYYVRTDKGALFAKVDNKLAGMMINGIKGEWVEKSFQNGTKRTTFVFKEDSVYGIEAMKLFLFSGYYMEVAK